MVLKKRAPEKDDRKLMLGVVNGEERAFEKLFERYAPSAFGLAVRICGDRSLAEDVVQETFLSIWRKPGSYTPDRGTVSAYVLGTLHHKAVDAVRHEESLRRRERATGGQATETTGDELLEEAWIALRRQQVREAVTHLTPVQREAIELAYFEGLTYSEVAQKLAIPLGTAKTRLRDGMIRLRDILSERRVEGV